MIIGFICFLLYASRKKWFVAGRSAVLQTLRLGHRNSVLMDEQDLNTGKKSAAQSSHTAKKQYQEPAFRHERVFETMALSCGKVQPTTLQCRFNRHTS